MVHQGRGIRVINKLTGVNGFDLTVLDLFRNRWRFVYPIYWISKYLQCSRIEDRAGNSVSRQWFASWLAHFLSEAGYNSRSFSTHSIRIGAATDLAMEGASITQIQLRGRLLDICVH